jgi:Na+/H+ antiporter NhaD/arsenite permease-like protein
MPESIGPFESGESHHVELDVIDAGLSELAPPTPSVVMLPSSTFMAGAAVVALAIATASRLAPMPLWLLSGEVLGTILGLFVFGSFRYQIHKNALTYGMLLIIVATFYGLPTSAWHEEIIDHGMVAWVRQHVLSFSGLDALIHADTMLFILGLTFFVSVIAQTRVLEGIGLGLLKRYRGAILPTFVSITAVVAAASGVLDGVSMIGLTIRTLVIIMLLAAAPTAHVRYAVMVCTAVTTICGVWLAYGEPPNLIMKANLYPAIDNAFFLTRCAPAAVAAYLVIAWQLRGRFRAKAVDVAMMDVLDARAADVRFLQARRHGEVMTPVELIEGHAAGLDGRARAVIERLRNGEALGLALIRADVPEPTRRLLLGHYVSDELADGLDTHYVYENAAQYEEAFRAELAVDEVLTEMSRERRRAQIIGAWALVPFAAMLVAHGFDHRIPLFVASFLGFCAAMPAIARFPRMRSLALRDARLEYAEYYFLFPLFLSITLLTSAGFFDQLQDLIKNGIDTIGASHVAFMQFLGCTFFSAILDNNVVADFASRGLHGLNPGALQLLAMAQILGYALGGCWTHIGCAQSVVAYAFIQRDIDERYTPVQWIKDMTPVILQTLIVLGCLIYLQGALIRAAE